MKVFISWSGERSKLVASALREWIPDIIQSVEPWMSDTDIDAGLRWGRKVEKELSETQFGIICLSKDNINAPWILFEAGALAKTIEDTYVCPYLIDLTPSELPQGPLAQFQSKRANEQETRELIFTINKALKEHALPEDRLDRAYARAWPELKSVLDELPQLQEIEENPRSLDDMMREVLDLVRGLSRRDSLQQIGSHLMWQLAEAQAEEIADDAKDRRLVFIAPGGRGKTVPFTAWLNQLWHENRELSNSPKEVKPQKSENSEQSENNEEST